VLNFYKFIRVVVNVGNEQQESIPKLVTVVVIVVVFVTVSPPVVANVRAILGLNNSVNTNIKLTAFASHFVNFH